MAFITLWRRGAVHCMAVLNGEQISVRLVDDGSLLKDIVVQSMDAALQLAEIWDLEASRATRHRDTVGC